MITISNLSLKYGNQTVIDHLNLELPNSGFIALLGPSGCGKTSIFNCLAGLISYEGEIIINGKNISLLNEKEMNEYRVNNIGFIFQDFKLFNLDTVSHNISFPLDVINGYTSKRNDSRIKDLVRMVKLENKENEIVKNLSGGEKQRVAIARALINNPSLLLADEPTGALDEENACNIMDLLRNISKDKLVIIVSHDKDLVSKFVDQIIYLEDGKIIKKVKVPPQKEKRHLHLIASEYRKKKPAIPFSFLFRHSLSSIKERKWRTILINIVTSLGLIGVGLATSLSSSISMNIKKACSSLMNENQIMISNKEKNDVITVLGKDYEEALELKDRYKEYIDDVGVVYQTNFNYHFPSRNEFHVISGSKDLKISSYSVKNINEYLWLDNYEIDFFPYKPVSLNNDEVVMSLSLSEVYEICYELQIMRTVKELASFIENNDLYLVVDVANNEWLYEDEQIYKIKAFTLDYESHLYHYNHRWNEVVFESEMRFPSSYDVSLASSAPWTLKKLNYIELKDDIEKEIFLSNIKNDEKCDSFLFEVASSSYFPSTIKYDTPVKDINKIILLKNNIHYINPRVVNKIDETIEEISSPIKGSIGGYAIYEEALMMGFSNYAYFSFDKDYLYESLDKYSSTLTSINQSLSNMDNILVGHYSKNSNNGVIFKQIPDIYRNSIEINSLDEIVVSSGLMNKFNTKNKNILTLAFTINEQRMMNGKVLRDFRYVDLLVKAVIPSEEIIIYHNEDWPISFFQNRLGVSIYHLGINTIAFDVKDNVDINEVLIKTQRAFPDYKVTNPMSSLNESIDEVCFYLEFVMYIFSLISVIISIFLLSICNYLHILEIKGDIGLSRCIGASKFESTKFIFSHAYIMAFISFLIASFELVFINFLVGKILAKNLEVGFIFSINPISIILMFLLALMIASISSIFISFKVVKMSPLESLKVI